MHLPRVSMKSPPNTSRLRAHFTDGGGTTGLGPVASAVIGHLELKFQGPRKLVGTQTAVRNGRELLLSRIVVSSWSSIPITVEACRQTKQDKGQPNQTRCDTLSAVYQHSKVARLRCWLWMRLLLRCSRRRIEVRSREEYVVSLWINLQCFRAKFRLNGFNLAEPVR